MNTEEDNNRKGKMNTPTQEAELVVELNSDILKTIHSLQAELQSFREDSLNERKEHQVINEALLRNMMGGIPQGKPTHSTKIPKGNVTINGPEAQEKNKKRNVPLKLWKEIIIVLPVMNLLYHVEKNKEAMTIFRGGVQKNKSPNL